MVNMKKTYRKQGKKERKRNHCTVKSAAETVELIRITFNCKTSSEYYFTHKRTHRWQD